MRISIAVTLLAASVFAWTRARAIEASLLMAAEASIQVDDLKRHVQTLADDTFEGREAGSRGGRAASIYLGKEFQRHRLAGGGTQGYYQPFGAGYSNILGRLEGSDPQLRREVVVVSAHYDHVGYGNSRNSYGPTGYIHNGADDNASGVAGLLETIEAFGKIPARPRRTILFALWDSEEKGLLGSKHWLANPTVPLADVACMVNLDMIGRLRGEKLDVVGTRTAGGLRQLVAMHNHRTNLLLNYTWELTENSDHYTFYQRGIPVLMLHTGLHGDYHRPSDDVERIAFDGMQRVTRLLFQTVCALADQETRPRFRAASRAEYAGAYPRQEQPLPPLASRLGVHCDSTSGGGNQGVVVTRVEYNSAAQRAGLRAGDTIVEFAGVPCDDFAMLRKLVWAAESPANVLIRRQPGEELRLQVQLAGAPIRLGISWRVDDAEPTAVILNRVVPGTPAAEAGLLVGDRIYQVNGRSFSSPEEFRGLLVEAGPTIELLVERSGRIAAMQVVLAVAAQPKPAAPQVDAT
jgi:hypothetical protein